MAERTTLLKKRGDMPRGPLEQCHEGTGTLDWRGVLTADELPRKAVNFMHDLALPPQTSIGPHRHTADTEFYYMITGRGIMTLDGCEYEMDSGDIAAVFPGGEHSLENRSEQEVRILVFSIPAE